MSRICVKNLPKYVAEDRLREFFSQKGEVTDTKLMRTKDGKSRQFAFIGFHTEQEAQEAIKYFNKSYLDTSRITCEIARKVGDPDIPRPWSKYSKKKEEKASEEPGGKAVKDKGKTSKKGNEIDDPQYTEFVEVMQPRSKSKLWDNGTVVAPAGSQGGEVGKKETQEKKGGDKVVLQDVDQKESDGSEDDESHDVANVEAVSDMDYFKSRVKQSWSDSESESSDSVEDEDEVSDSPKNSYKTKAAVKANQDGQHGTFLNDLSRNKAHGEAQPPEDSNGEILDPENPPSVLKDEKDEVVEFDRLFVRNLPYTATEDELEEHFSRFGNVSQVHIIVDKDTKRSKGFAYIHYTDTESAARALEELDNSIFQGRLLHVMPAKEKTPSKKTDASTSQGSKSFKQRREEEKKASEAGGNTKAWNSLFMRPDTVVENIARRHGVSKSELLDREADDLAVRIALGETQVIAETKKALANAGVNVMSLEEFALGKTDGIKRSNHVLLVKNLPYGSSEGELATMFGKFGSLDKIILPPTKTLALVSGGFNFESGSQVDQSFVTILIFLLLIFQVVFLEPSEARAAFKGLAYKRYKDAPLYLEWAPGNVLSQSAASNSVEKNAAVGEHYVKRVMLQQSVEGISDVDIDPDRIESRSLFVKNLNFKTSDESLKKHFSEQIKDGRILSVRIKKHLKNGKNVSMGFGFMEFDSVETATKVCHDYQGTVLDGHALILQLCHVKKDEQSAKKVDKDKSTTKILVKNVAFEATEKDLRQLFSPFGQQSSSVSKTKSYSIVSNKLQAIKSLRLPMKFGHHRGFAFVEYVTKQEAQNALKALSATHLYGRHLVLERAKEGESLEELRARTAAQFTGTQNVLESSTKLSKKRKHMAVLDEGSMKFQRTED
ncbi:hypothetical protein Tsubulata_039981 [Turnera subulata]|uniref:RRM domain-containing protein n=1 Tax=Turnera subulata TaxID=218843 RepID=A0A9Q0JLT0_9ROSI|nr:hypothetical protein Tsubulata_039981 [Turnera subulata]